MHSDLHKHIVELVVNYIEQVTGYRPTQADYTKPLNTFGLTSVQGMLLVGELEDEFSIDLPHDLLLGKDSLSAFCLRIEELAKG